MRSEGWRSWALDSPLHTANPHLSQKAAADEESEMRSRVSLLSVELEARSAPSAIAAREEAAAEIARLTSELNEAEQVSPRVVIFPNLGCFITWTVSLQADKWWMPNASLY